MIVSLIYTFSLNLSVCRMVQISSNKLVKQGTRNVSEFMEKYNKWESHTCSILRNRSGQ